MKRYLFAIGTILILWQLLPAAFEAPDYSFPRLSVVVLRMMEEGDVFAYNTLVSIKAIGASLLFAIMLVAHAACFVWFAIKTRKVREELYT